MADTKKPEGLVYKGHPLRRVDNFIYYGSMADKYIVLLQILDTVKEQDMDVAKKVSVQLQLTAPAVPAGAKFDKSHPRCYTGRKDAA